jgi:3-hydroxyacyl-CoA dehydrogenase
MNIAQTTRHGAVAVIHFGEPPVNTLGHRTRAALTTAIEQAVADTTVTAIVVTGNNGLFSGGADIREFGTATMLAGPRLLDLIHAVDSSVKPVVAAIEGTCVGGGLELALGCHYRVATQDARLAFPEIKLGLLPGAGGSQRLPRLVGIEAAINMILSGEMVPAASFDGTALLDRVVREDAVGEAIRLAGEKAAQIAASAGLPKASDRQVPAGDRDALIGFARTAAKARFPGLPAPLRCLDAIEAAAAGPWAEGFETEQRLFGELMMTPESRALRHAFLAERAAAHIPDVPRSTPVREIRSAAIIGAGTMGSGIAISFLNAGIPVRLLDVGREALDRGVAHIRATYASQIKRGRLKPAEAEVRERLLRPTLDYAELESADIAVEAVFEDFDVKAGVLTSLDRVLRPGAILATNTSTLDVDRLASVTARPGDVVGTHFFSPAHVMRLLEVVRGKATAADVLATTMRLAKKLGKTAVVSGVCDGFIGNRMIEQYLRQALFMLEEGASPARIDAAIEGFGFAMGPFRMSDLAGNDIGWQIRKRRAIDQPRLVYSALADRLCELGRFGQKTGRGWYDYKPGSRQAHGSSAVEELIVAHRRALGIAPRVIDSREIVDRLVYALINEGARILEEGIAYRASDIDVVYLKGYGFPAWRGGPMRYADEVGAYHVLQRLRELARNRHGDPDFWRAAPLIERIAVTGGTFDSLVSGL